MTIEEFKKAKGKIEEMKQQQAKAQGGFEQAVEQLKSFGISEIGAAEKLLIEYTEKRKKDEKELATLFQEFEELLGTAT